MRKDDTNARFINIQTDHWGTVEWAHDLELHDTTSRLAAATLFVHFNPVSYTHLTLPTNREV